MKSRHLACLKVLAGVVLLGGPAAARAQTSEASPERLDAPARVHLQGEQSQTGYLVLDESSPSPHYVSLCVAPCSVDLPKAPLQMALTVPGYGTAYIEKPVEVTGPATLRAVRDSRANKRRVGWFVLGGGAAVGGAMITYGLLRREWGCADGSGPLRCGYSPNWPSIFIGSLTVLVSSIVGTVLVLRHDRYSIEVVPDAFAQVVAPTRATREGAAPGAEAQGLGLRVAF